MTNRTIYGDQEWGLLVGLPQSVAVAAISAESDNVGRSLDEGHAGMDAIAAGRESGVALVREVAGEVVERVGGVETGGEPLVIRVDDRDAELRRVLERAREAAALLAAKASPGDAAAYKHWLVGIADQVVNAAKSGGFLGLGGEWVSESERRFLDELRAVFDD
jgi:hypothetical protein